jgi:hypothetical protein
MGEISTLLKQNNIIIQPEVINFNEIRDVALTAFNTKNDFTLLHTVTGCHAFSIILPYLADQNSALRALWKAILVAYLSTGLNFNSVKIRPSSLDCDFDNLIKHVIQSTDVHAIKLVYSCSCEYLKDKEPMYYTVAKRAVFGE